MTKLTGIAALALLASLSACGSADQPTEDAAPAAGMTMDGPYAESEMTMDKSMKWDPLESTCRHASLSIL